MTGAALVIQDLVAGYEPGLPIVRGATLHVRRGEILALLGPNGAGKSTLLRAVAGLVRIESGRVLLDGDDVTGRAVHRLVRAGVGFVPQTDNVFTRMSVEDHLHLAAAALPRAERRRAGRRHVRAVPRSRPRPAVSSRGGSRAASGRCWRWSARAPPRHRACSCSTSRRRGWRRDWWRWSSARLRDARALGVTLVLVEQNMRAALAIADRGCVMVEGRPRLVASAAELAGSSEVARLFLGAR